MKTLLFTLEYPPFKGGVANYYGQLVKYWPESDNIFILHNNDGELINRSWPFLKWLPALAALKGAVKNNNVNHIVVGQILPLGIAAWLYAKFYKIKYSVILHGLDFSLALKAKRKRIAVRLILGRAHKIIINNHYTASLVKDFLSPEAANKIIVVNPGVEKKNIGQSLGGRLREKSDLKNKIILLSVGRLVKRKGFDKVIEALPEILKQAPNLIYVIVGNGAELKNLKFKILDLKLNDFVKVIAGAGDDERDAWYQACDIFIMPSRNINGDYEGFGIVYLEANLAGKPVIAGRGGGVGDAVENGLNGLTVDPKNVEEIAGAVIRLATDEELRRKLGERGRERAIREFNWPKQIKKIYQTIYD